VGLGICDRLILTSTASIIHHRDMQRQNLSSIARMRDCPLDPEGSCAFPNTGHEPIITRSFGKSVAEPNKHSSFIQISYPWMNHKSQATLPTAILFFD
jgi:hypothetical protein